MRALVFLLAFTLAAVGARAQTNPGGTRVVLLGTGAPPPDPDRSGPATAVVVNGQAYIVDAGPGVVRRASAAARADSIPALRSKDLRVVFITHLHSDHTLGLPDLMLTMAPERGHGLVIYGPPGIRRMVDRLLDAYREDLKVRTSGPSPASPQVYRMEVHEVLPGEVYRDSNVTVSAFAVPHGDWKYAYAYRFDARDRSIVVSGDTGPSDALVAACHGCDVLVHEVVSARGLQTRPAAGQAYFGTFHTSGLQLGDIATRAQPKLLVLTHLVSLGQPFEELGDEVRTRFKGEVVVGRDLGVY